MPKLVRAAVLTNYLEVALRHGLDADRLLSQVGLSRPSLEDPENLIPVDAAVQLLEESAAAGGNPGFGLCLAESRQLAHLGAISLLLGHQPTLRDALQAMRHYRHLFNDTVAILLEETARMVIIRLEVVCEPPRPCRQSNELAIGVLFRLCAALLGARWRPHSVHFSHQEPSDLQLHRRLFGCQLEFASEFNGIVCSGSDLNVINPHADPTMARLARRYLDSLAGSNRPSMLYEARKAIYLLLPMGRASIEQVAQTLGMHVRTLQRHLKAADTTFHELLNAVRRDLVIRYLETPGYPLGQIADMLGYSVPGSFTRWFNSQFGMSPAAWRDTSRTACKKAGADTCSGPDHATYRLPA
ncbi:HTH-type transcriptional regulator VirS [compost metagenome]